MNSLQYDLARAAYTAYHGGSEEHEELFDNLPYKTKQLWLAVAEAVADALGALVRGL